MAYPTVVMEMTVSREVIQIDSRWNIAELQHHLSDALSGTGPALSTSQLNESQIDSKVALVVATSGSTGNPKNVALSAASLLTNARATHAFLQASPGDRWSLLLPTEHIAGLNVLIRSIELGTQPCGVENKADFTAIVPTQLFRALNGDAKLLTHLQGCKAVLVGGGPLSSKLRIDAQEKGIRIHETYGMTESCGGVIYDGYPLDGVSVSIINGRVALKGKQLAIGYLGVPLPLENGWFLTQDLGELDNGKLRILGRVDDQIISGGEKISLSAVEDFLQSEFSTDQIVAFAQQSNEWGEQLCIATTADLSLERVSPLLKAKFGEHVAPKKLLKISKIPYLSIGKPDRKKLANDNA